MIYKHAKHLRNFLIKNNIEMRYSDSTSTLLKLYVNYKLQHKYKLDSYIKYFGENNLKNSFSPDFCEKFFEITSQYDDK